MSMLSQREVKTPSNEFTWLTLHNPFWGTLFGLSFLGNVDCCRKFWFFYKVLLVWPCAVFLFCFCNCTVIFHIKNPRHFRPKVLFLLLHASGFRMWELQGRPTSSPSPAPSTSNLLSQSDKGAGNLL